MRELAAPSPSGRSLETIDYSQPEHYKVLPEIDGTSEAIRRCADGLKADTLERTLRRISRFVTCDTRDIPSSSWRPDHEPFDTLVRGFDHRDCARHALVFASLARACDLPTIYIKSFRHDWIRAYVTTGQMDDYAGHVFLEIHALSRWQLLDAQGMQLWDRHDPTNPELPGDFFAYEKGSCHHAMVHSTRRDLFMAESRQRFAGFDFSLLRPNHSPARPLGVFFALTVSDEWKTLSKRIPGLRSFDRSYWATERSNVSGGVLIVTSIGGRIGLPDGEVEGYLPISLPEIQARSRGGAGEVMVRDLADDTRVVLVLAPERDSLIRLLESVDKAQLCGESSTDSP